MKPVKPFTLFKPHPALLPGLLAGIISIQANQSLVADALPKINNVEAPLPSIEYEKYTLPNGLAVFLVGHHKLPIAVVNIWYRAAARHGG